MDGIEKLTGVLVLAATNRPDIIDPALLRPGRFDVRVDIPPPDERERLAILRIQTRGKPLAADVRLESIAATTTGRSGAELGGICQQAALNAIRELVAELRTAELGGASRPLSINARHFSEAIAGLSV
jgi:transitional endoplasmic reticulum ATPase